MIDFNSLPSLPQQSLALETRYTNVIDVQFVSKALAGGASCVRGAQWPTQELYPGDAAEVIATAYYEYNRSFEALAMIEGALAHVIRQRDTVTVRLAAGDHAALDRAESRLRQQLPEPESGSPYQITMEFSHWDRFGMATTSRTVEVPAFEQIELNYSSSTRAELHRLLESFDPAAAGRLVLWHGPPGGGKTWALRALGSAWRDWCTLRYVSDPERLLSEPSYLINLLHMRPSRQLDDEAWRLIVMEDTGELLSADAKQQIGQGLSRLLNVVDGLLGETSRALFLITTNEDLHTIHPAVARPGRCAQLLRFGPLDVEEANRWLEARGEPARVRTPTMLAELYALASGQDLRPAHRRPIGFV